VIRVTDGGPASPSLREELFRLATLRDVGLLVAVPVVLAIVYLLAGPSREALIFQTARPSVSTAFSAHYLHLSASHLLANLAIYGGAVGLGYPLALLGGIRRRYLSLVVAILLGFPFVLSALHLVLIGTGGLVGFSGLALALVGLLPLVLFAFLRVRIEGTVSINDAPSLFFFGMAAIAGRTAAPAAVVRPLVLLSVGIGVLYLVPLALRLAREGRKTGPFPLRRGYVELPVAAVILYFLFLALGFPSDPIETGGATTNLVVHLLAYALGFLGGYLTDRSMRALDTPTAPPPPPPPV
jgi:hypothetical protein